jgi:hypothetical protein
MTTTCCNDALKSCCNLQNRSSNSTQLWLSIPESTGQDGTGCRETDLSLGPRRHHQKMHHHSMEWNTRLQGRRALVRPVGAACCEMGEARPSAS